MELGEREARIRRGLLAIAGLGLLAMAGARLTPFAVQPAAAETSPAGHSHRESPAVARPELSGLRVVTRQQIEPARPAPPFRLVDQTGAPVQLEDLPGKAVLISFTYTNCPEACPLLTANYLQLQGSFSDAVAAGDLSLVFITTDPQVDTPERLLGYTNGVGGHWRFLTGDDGALAETWRDYGIYREVREEIRDIVVYHTYRTYLLDGGRMIRYQYDGVWQPRDVSEDIRTLLAAGPG